MGSEGGVGAPGECSSCSCVGGWTMGGEVIGSEDTSLSSLSGRVSSIHSGEGNDGEHGVLLWIWVCVGKVVSSKSIPRAGEFIGFTTSPTKVFQYCKLLQELIRGYKGQNG